MPDSVIMIERAKVEIFTSIIKKEVEEWLDSKYKSLGPNLVDVQFSTSKGESAVYYSIMVTYKVMVAQD